MIRIEKNIPIPNSGRGKQSARQIMLDGMPWGQMELGDSFVFESGSSGGLKKAAQRAGIEIEIRGIEFHGRAALSFRVWRVK